MTDRDTPAPADESAGYGTPADTRPEVTDDRRTPDDNRFGYGSEGYDVGEANPSNATERGEGEQ
ncbi:hypothetical protein V3W47_03520 [Deinococcus sp. YIM 134068]|uniref:hypothetical protein n=1 Tax=Deinococcus lichenicola TaxID=3118910 RepID=UPI002F937F1E